MIGFFMERKDGSHLRSGGSVYMGGVCVQVQPFVLISQGGDMVWTQQKLEDFRASHSVNEQVWRNVCERARREGITPVGRAVPAPLPEVAPDTTWMHRSGKGPYIVDALGTFQIDEGEQDLQPVVVYRNALNGSVWVRPLREFQERFTKEGA